MTTPIEITPVYDEIEYCSPTGYHWKEQGRLIGYEVSGGYWLTTKHTSIQSAKKENLFGNPCYINAGLISSTGEIL